MAFSFPLFFLFFTWATWRRVLTPGDSCEGSSSPLVVCDSEILFGQKIEEKGTEKLPISPDIGTFNIIGRRKSYLLINERIPRVSSKMRSPFNSFLSPTIAGIRNRCDPRIFREHDSAIWAYLVNLLSLHFINVLSRIFFFYKCWLIES